MILRITIFLLLILGVSSPRILAADAPPDPDAAISRGLEFLVSQQNDDGSFGAAQKPAMTGLALMSFLAAGDTPGVGRYGVNVNNAIEYLLSQAQPDGSFGKIEKPMYGQGIATLALAEAYGVVASENQRKRVAAVLSKAAELILSAQNVQKQEVYVGGWRYEPGSNDSDLSLSGWSALALRACQDVGIAVPKAAVERAVQFVLRCYNLESRGFAYQPGAPPAPGTTGIGVLCLHLLDAGGRPESRDAAQSLIRRPVDDQSQYKYYGYYYATQAAYQAGEPAWSAVSKVTFDRLLKSQDADGGWPDAGESAGAGRVYETSMALLTLSIPYRLLPIYQR